MNPEADTEAEAFVREGLYANPRSRFDEVVDALGVRAFFGRGIAGLSGGERQLCRIARALAAEVPHVFLDEPDSYLGRKNRERFTSLVRALSEHSAIVIVTHGAITFTDADRLLVALSPELD
jgi:ABC-type cobalamin/Fe3+-siderophores transport system ATPase subunit